MSQEQDRSVTFLKSQISLPDFSNDQLTSVRSRIKPAFVRSELGKQFKFFDQDVSRAEFSKRLKDPIVKLGGIEPFAREGQFQYPEYNFSEIITIVETEPLVARAFNRKETLCLKQGWDIVGKNQKTVEYVKQRLSEMSHVSGVSTEHLIRDIASDLINFSNWFAALVRNPKLSSGRRRNIGGKEVDPIAGIFSIPPETIVLKFDKLGNLTSIAQEIYGATSSSGNRFNVFDQPKFLHFKVNEKKGYSVGTPLLVPVRDDVAALRRIEENVEILLYQYLFPLYTYKVGTENSPAREYPNGLTEIDVVQREWSQLPPEGAIVIPERHEIEVLGARNSALDASQYLEYFKQRVLAGIEISSLDIGDASTSNRSTSENLSRILVDGVKYLQRRIEFYFNQHIIKQLLLESSFDDQEVLDPNNQVSLRFREIDIDAQIKVQNHAQQLYSAHGITEVELRRSLGYEPLTEEERDQTYWKLIQEPLALIAAKQSGFSAEAQALAENPQSDITPEQIAIEQKAEKEAIQSKEKSKTNVSTKSTSGQRSVSSTNRPSNQHGTKQGPDGRKSSEDYNPFEFILSDSHSSANPKVYQSSINSLASFWNDAMNHLKFMAFSDSNDIHRLFGSTLFAAKKPFERYLLTKVYEGIGDALNEMQSRGSSFQVRIPSLFIKDIQNQIDHLILKLIKDVQSKIIDISSNKNLLPVDIIDTLTYRTLFIDSNESSRAYNLGRALGFRHLGVKIIQIKPLDQHTCDKCKVHVDLELDNLNYLDLPPLAHPNARQIVYPLQNKE